LTPDPFYSSQAWRTLRARAVKLSAGRCLWCGADVRGWGKSRVDHIRSRREAPQLALVLGNLRVLCASCDNRRHADKGGAINELRRTGANGLPLSAAHHWNRPR
jgi:5-methylcytosine-specific restriction endonuclease McrA